MATIERQIGGFAGKTVTVKLLTDDIRRRMVGLLVSNASAAAIWVGVTNGPNVVVPAGTLNRTIPFVLADERDIEQKSGGLWLGCPISVAYPWFG